MEYPANAGGGPLLWCVFFQVRVLQEELYQPLHAFLWVRLVYSPPKAISMWQTWKCQVPQTINCIKPLLKTAPKQVCKGVHHEWPRSSIIYNLDSTPLWRLTRRINWNPRCSMYGIFSLDWPPNMALFCKDSTHGASGYDSNKFGPNPCLLIACSTAPATNKKQQDRDNNVILFCLCISYNHICVILRVH